MMPALATRTSTGPSSSSIAGDGRLDLVGVGDVAADRGEAGLVDRGGRRGDRDPVAGGGEGPGAGQPDAPAAAGDEHRSTGGAGRRCASSRGPLQHGARPSSCRRRSPPSAPGRRGAAGPASAASARAIGIDAAEVLPVRSSTLAVRSASMPSLAQADMMIRALAWWGTNRAMSSAVTLARAMARSADSTMIRTARRKTSGPSISMVPPASAWRMWRREPSEPRSQPSSRPGPLAPLEHDGARPRRRRGWPWTGRPSRRCGTSSRPRRAGSAASRPAGGRRPPPARRRSPEQAALRSMAPPSMSEGVLHGATRWPASAASGVQVHRSTRSTSLGRRAGVGQGGAAGLDGQGGGAVRRPALADAGALHDPRVGGVEGGLEVLVGDDLLGQRGAPPGEARAGRVHATHHAAAGTGRHAVRSQATGWLRVSRSPATASRPITAPRKGIGWPRRPRGRRPGPARCARPRPGRRARRSRPPG